MFISGLQVYVVHCTKCEWNDEVTVNSHLAGFISNLLKPQIPTKCPNCKAKTKHHEHIGYKF